MILRESVEGICISAMSIEIFGVNFGCEGSAAACARSTKMCTIFQSPYESHTLVTPAGCISSARDNKAIVGDVVMTMYHRLLSVALTQYARFILQKTPKRSDDGERRRIITRFNVAMSPAVRQLNSPPFNGSCA